MCTESIVSQNSQETDPTQFVSAIRYVYAILKLTDESRIVFLLQVKSPVRNITCSKCHGKGHRKNSKSCPRNKKGHNLRGSQIKVIILYL